MNARADAEPEQCSSHGCAPAVALALGDELLERAAPGRDEKRLPRVRVVERDLAGRLGALLDEGGRLPVASILGEVAIEVADAVGHLFVAVGWDAFQNSNASRERFCAMRSGTTFVGMPRHNYSFEAWSWAGRTNARGQLTCRSQFHLRFS